MCQNIKLFPLLRTWTSPCVSEFNVCHWQIPPWRKLLKFHKQYKKQATLLTCTSGVIRWTRRCQSAVARVQSEQLAKICVSTAWHSMFSIPASEDVLTIHHTSLFNKQHFLTSFSSVFTLYFKNLSTFFANRFHGGKNNSRNHIQKQPQQQHRPYFTGLISHKQLSLDKQM